MAKGPTFLLEKAFIGGPVCGVDEAGRGPWAGPVSAAAVILDPKRTPKGLDDSKKLSAKAREALEVEIQASAIAWCVPTRRCRFGECRSAQLVVGARPTFEGLLVCHISSPSSAGDAGNPSTGSIRAAASLRLRARGRRMVRR